MRTFFFALYSRYILYGGQTCLSVSLCQDEEMLMLTLVANHLSEEKKKKTQMGAKWEWQIQGKCLSAAWQGGSQSVKHRGSAEKLKRSVNKWEKKWSKWEVKMNYYCKWGQRKEKELKKTWPGDEADLGSIKTQFTNSTEWWHFFFFFWKWWLNADFSLRFWMLLFTHSLVRIAP